MPRAKPPSPLRGRQVRLTDEQWEKFKELGGSAWLRKFVGGRPARYFEVFKRPE